MGSVQVISVDNCLNYQPYNMLREVFRFRHEWTQRQKWSNGLTFQKTSINGQYSETDDQDKPATVYFAKHDDKGEMVGVVRVHPSLDLMGRPISMISQTFNSLVDPDKGLPHAQNIWETSRLLVNLDKYSKEERVPIVNELLASTFFYAHQKNISGLFCFMAVSMWESTYKRMGLEVERLGPNGVIHDQGRTYEIYAGLMKINDRVIENLCRATSLDPSILDFGTNPPLRLPAPSSAKPLSPP
jgi:N-acyl-L-homoserine lactone synthetase